MQEITNKIYYVGVNDRNKNLFEGLWPLPNGVSYNSYIIDDEKVCLIDTVEVDFFIPYIKNIQQVIGDRKIDYLVINHMEPDVGLHVIDYEVVNLAIANNLLDILDIGYKEINLNCIDEAYLLVVNDIGVVRHSVGQRPQTLK